MVSHLNSFRYVEVEGEYHETPFQAFEAVHMIKAPQVENQRKSESSIFSYKDAQAVVEAGDPEGWGHVLEVKPKFDKHCLGFRPSQPGMAPKAANLHTPIKFASGGIIHDGHANAIGAEEDSDCDFENWIRPSVPSQSLSN